MKAIKINAWADPDSVQRTFALQDDIHRMTKIFERVLAIDSTAPNWRLVNIVVQVELDKGIGRDDRLRFLSWLFGREVWHATLAGPKGLTDAEGHALIAWGQPQKMDDTWYCSALRWRADVAAIRVCFSRQLELGQKV